MLRRFNGKRDGNLPVHSVDSRQWGLFTCKPNYFHFRWMCLWRRLRGWRVGRCPPQTLSCLWDIHFLIFSGWEGGVFGTWQTPPGPGRPPQDLADPPRTWQTPRDLADTSPQGPGRPPRDLADPPRTWQTPRDLADPPGPGRPPRDLADTSPQGPGRPPPPDLADPPGTWQTPPGPGRPPREADSSIRSTSGRYASYWNAFLLLV